MIWRGLKITENYHVLVSQFHGNFCSKTLSNRKSKSIFRDVKWCFNASWGLKGLSHSPIPYFMLRYRRIVWLWVMFTFPSLYHGSCKNRGTTFNIIITSRPYIFLVTGEWNQTRRSMIHKLKIGLYLIILWQCKKDHYTFRNSSHGPLILSYHFVIVYIILSNMKYNNIKSHICTRIHSVQFWHIINILLNIYTAIKRLNVLLSTISLG